MKYIYVVSLLFLSFGGFAQSLCGISLTEYTVPLWGDDCIESSDDDSCIFRSSIANGGMAIAFECNVAVLDSVTFDLAKNPTGSSGSSRFLVLDGHNYPEAEVLFSVEMPEDIPQYYGPSDTLNLVTIPVGILLTKNADQIGGEYSMWFEPDTLDLDGNLVTYTDSWIFATSTEGQYPNTPYGVNVGKWKYRNSFLSTSIDSLEFDESWDIYMVLHTSECNIPGDFDFSGAVDTSDMLTFLTHFGCVGSSPPWGPPVPCKFDLEIDGDVDTSDLLFFLTHFGESCI